MEFESPEGCRAFDYYRSQSAPVLGNILDSEFWGGLVMRLSVSEPVVRHAVLALSRLHEHTGTANCDNAATIPAFVFAEYGKSIDALKKWQDGPVIPLLACVLFVCIEFLLDNEEATKLHIFQGRQLLCALHNEPLHTRVMIMQDLVPMYTRLGLAAFLYGVQPARVPESLQHPLSPPAKYEGISQARSYLYHILDDALRFSTSAKTKLYGAAVNLEEMQKLQDKQQQILSYLEQWHASFVVLISTLKLSQATISVQCLLHIYYNAAVIWTSTALSTHEIAYDEHISSFAAVISNAASIINGTHRGSRLHAFSFETELVAPIYWTVIKCRHPALRRAALRLLMRDELRGRRENLWHSQEAITIALRAIQLEEQKMSGTCLDITADATNGSGHCATMNVSVSFKSNLSVPTFRPPTTTLGDLLDADDMSGSPESCEARWSFFDGPSYSVIPTVADDTCSDFGDAVNTSSPYGIADAQRIRNILIGPREIGGVWVTIFKEPIVGDKQWDVTKELLSFES
jgi:hypothetical protein